MKLKLIAITLALVAFCPAYGKDLGVDITTATTSGTVAARARFVTFIFNTSFTGTIAGACFAGTAGVCSAGSPADLSLTIPAPAGDTLTAITYTVSAGSVRIIRTQ